MTTELDAIGAGLPTKRALSSWLIGRDRELSVLPDLLGPGSLVTLTGSAGVGKSALARAALITAGLRGGTAFVEVDLTDVLEDEVAFAWLQDLLSTAVGRAGGRTSLLVDNCDRVIGGVARAVTELLREQARLSVVCTSRVPLDVYAERLLPVPALATDAHGDAVRLFTERVSPYYRESLAHDDGPLLVANICAAVEGVPLAIELAAEAVGTLTLDEVLERSQHGEYLQRSRLRDVPERHRSMNHALAWGEGALSAPEIDLLRRLSVFQSVVDVAGAQRLGGLRHDEAAGALRALVHKNLLISSGDGHGDFAYRMPQLVRRRYQPILESDPEMLAAAQDGHADACLAFVRTAKRELLVDAEVAEVGQPAGGRWLAAMRERLPDLRAAVRHLRRQQRHTEVLHLLLALEEPLLAAGLAREYIAELQEASHQVASGDDDWVLAAEGLLVVARWALEHGRDDWARAALFRAGGCTGWRGGRVRGRIVMLLREIGQRTALSAAERPLAAVPPLAVSRQVTGTAGTAAAESEAQSQEATATEATTTEATTTEPTATEPTATESAVTEATATEAADLMARAQELFALGRYVLAAAETLRAAETDGTGKAGGSGWTGGAAGSLALRQLSETTAARATGVRTTEVCPGLDAAGGSTKAEPCDITAQLTPRQIEVALLVAEGLTNRQIARRLDISEWTVVNHLRQVMRKLECPSRIHVARVLRHHSA